MNWVIIVGENASEIFGILLEAAQPGELKRYEVTYTCQVEMTEAQLELVKMRMSWVKGGGKLTVKEVT